MSKSYSYKVLIAGDGGVGKTTLLHRYVKGVFIEDLKMTMGVEFFTVDLVVNDCAIMVQLWDFAGQDHFRFMLEGYAMGASAALILIDLTRFPFYG